MMQQIRNASILLLLWTLSQGASASELVYFVKLLYSVVCTYTYEQIMLYKGALPWQTTAQNTAHFQEEPLLNITTLSKQCPVTCNRIVCCRGKRSFTFCGATLTWSYFDVTIRLLPSVARVLYVDEKNKHSFFNPSYAKFHLENKFEVYFATLQWKLPIIHQPSGSISKLIRNLALRCLWTDLYGACLVQWKMAAQDEWSWRVAQSMVGRRVAEERLSLDFRHSPAKRHKATTFSVKRISTPVKAFTNTKFLK